MKNEAFFASLIRGAFIEKAHAPWTVACGPADGRGEALELNLEPGDEKAVAAALAASYRESAFAKRNAIPAWVRVKSGGSVYFYLTAPDYRGIENLRSGVMKASTWQVEGTPPDCCASRAMVVKNRIALVTGGAQGFGEEIVRGLAAAGAFVFIADINKAGAEKLAAVLNSGAGGTTAFPVEVNVGEEASVEKMFETIALTTGGLDLCVSNAGVLRASPILEQDMEAFKFVTGINYTAFALVTKHCGLLMKAQNAAAPSWKTDIIQINSKSGLEGSNKNGAYAGSKFGGIGLVQSYALELVAYNIKVNAICPGNFLDGPLWADPEKGLFVQYLKTGKVPGAKTTADVRAFYEAKVPMRRGCTGADVMRGLFYLVEQEYETGQALPVTGGQVMLH